MSAIRSFALLCALATLSIDTVVARVDVQIDFDKTFNFTTVRSWGWNPSGPGEVKMARTSSDDPKAMTAYAQPIVVDAVTTEIGKRGLQPAATDPDIFVTYYLLLTTEMSAQTMGQFLPSTASWGLPYFPQATQSLKMMNQGALVLDLSARGTVVWRGVARAQIKMDADAKKRETLLRQGVRDLLRRYPPKP